MKPRAIDIQLTSRCNLKCPGCWGAKRYPKDNDMSLERFSWLIKEIVNSIGFNTVVYDGGEPFLVEYLEEFLSLAKRNNLNNVISTNGTLLQEKRYILSYLTAIGLPLDGPTDEIHSQFRQPKDANHFEILINALNFLSKYNQEINIKVGTVVTALNKYYIKDIGKLIIDKGFKVNCWKLYQFLPNFGQNKKNQIFCKKNTVDDQEFSDLFLEVSEHFPEITIIKNYNPRNYGNIIIAPNGDISTEMDKSGNIEPYIGNVFNDSVSKTIATISEMLNKQASANRIIQTYQCNTIQNNTIHSDGNSAELHYRR